MFISIIASSNESFVLGHLIGVGESYFDRYLYGLRLNWRIIHTHAHTIATPERTYAYSLVLQQDKVRYVCIHGYIYMKLDVYGTEQTDSYIWDQTDEFNRGRLIISLKLKLGSW